MSTKIALSCIPYLDLSTLAASLFYIYSLCFIQAIVRSARFINTIFPSGTNTLFRSGHLRISLTLLVARAPRMCNHSHSSLIFRAPPPSSHGALFSKKKSRRLTNVQIKNKQPHLSRRIVIQSIRYPGFSCRWRTATFLYRYKSGTWNCSVITTKLQPVSATITTTSRDLIATNPRSTFSTIPE